MSRRRQDVEDYSDNQAVFSQGDPAEAIFYIQKGEVKLTVVSHNGKEAVVAILGMGDFLGEGCLGPSRYAWQPPPPCQTARSCGWKSAS